MRDKLSERMPEASEVDEEAKAAGTDDGKAGSEETKQDETEAMSKLKKYLLSSRDNKPKP